MLLLLRLTISLILKDYIPLPTASTNPITPFEKPAITRISFIVKSKISLFYNKFCF